MIQNQFSFELITQNGKARVGRINTLRGSIETPAFMPVGTQGTVKGIFVDDILKTDTQIILGNTYHLLLRPFFETKADVVYGSRFLGGTGYVRLHYYLSLIHI